VNKFLSGWTAKVQGPSPALARMKKEETRLKIRVRLEPELEAIAKEWGPVHSLEVAATWERWAHQLRIRAKIILKDRFWQKPKPVFRRVGLRRARLN
jgi:hypothetical protein